MSRPGRGGAVVPIGVVVLALAGCGPLASTGPPMDRTALRVTPTGAASRTGAAGGSAGPGPSALALAQATHEYPSPPAKESVAVAAPDAAGAVRLFAEAYVNWTARTVAADMRALAVLSVGQARSAMELAAAHTTTDDELQRAGIANAGTVEAIAPLPGSPRRYVVVTRETTSAAHDAAYAGIGAVWHVTVATVTPLDGGGWAVSGWQPES